MGPEVFELEKKLAAFSKVKNVITCSSGTDALMMVLMAKKVGPGDAIFLPSFTYTATPEVVAILGATPVFVDVYFNTYNIDPKSLIKSIKIAKEKGLNPKAIISVDLFGQPSDYNSLEKIANENKLWILADAAQSYGGQYLKKKVGKLAMQQQQVFFQQNHLGVMEMVELFSLMITNLQILRSIRLHGKGDHKYDNVRIGLNARLDTIQASILLEKIKIFNDELKERQKVADYYNKMLKSIVQVPSIIFGAKSAWAQYTIQLPDKSFRDKNLIDELKKVGIPTMIYYQKPLHLQTAYKKFPKSTSLKVSEEISGRVLSLPLNLKYSSYIIEKFCNILKS